jgi:serine/threonine protein phosphatase PrpC
MTAFSTPTGMFYVVADGMGGHRGGAEASRRVVDGYQTHLNSFLDGTNLSEVLQQATSLTNAEILAESQSGDPAVAGMGSTVVMALLKSTPTNIEMMTAHIGDSRAYLLRSGQLYRLTRDHSAVQRMVDEQLITPEMARTHPDLNILTRAIGKQPDVAIEVGEMFELYPGDTVLLCTDGLWGPLSDELIAQELVAERSAQQTADALVQLALDAGSDDNITLQILKIESRNNHLRSYPPPVTALDFPSHASQNGGTQPGPALSDASRLAPLAGASSVGYVAKKRPLLHYAVAAVLCLCLAGAAWFSVRHFRIQWPPTKQKDQSKDMQFKCGPNEEMTPSGKCKPKSGLSPAQLQENHEGGTTVSPVQSRAGSSSGSIDANTNGRVSRVNGGERAPVTRTNRQAPSTRPVKPSLANPAVLPPEPNPDTVTPPRPPTQDFHD